MKSETNENEKKNVKNFGMKNNKEIPWEADEQETKNADWPHKAGREINHARNLSPIKIAIDPETTDNIVRDSMLDQYYNIKEQIEIAKNIDDITEWQKEDLEYNEKLMDATIVILKHFAAYADWPKELKERSE